MKQPIAWDRRRFLQLAGSTSLCGVAGGRFGWAATLGAARPAARFAYIGTEDAIHVYAIASAGRFIKQQTIASAHPVAMAIHGTHLYVANGVSQHGSLPRGSLEAYARDASTGRLEWKNRVPLSLSGISPRDLAVAPDGRSVVVAVHGGGAYNVVAVHEDGRMGRVSGILKEIGSGPHPLQAAAHPAAVIFDRAGRVLTADQGSDKLSVLSLTNGELAVHGRCEVAAGSGPSSLVLHPDGKRLYVAHAFQGAISILTYDASQGLNHQQTFRSSSAGEAAALAIHPSGEVLYSTHGDDVQAWKIALNGDLEPLTGVRDIKAKKLSAMVDGKSLLALTNEGVVSMKIEAATGMVADPVKLAALSATVSIAIA
jgi:6-phosphogluconolactonase